MRPHQSVQAMRVWQGKIQEYNIKDLITQPFERCGQPVHMLQLYVRCASFAKQFQEQPHVSWVIFNKEDADAFQVHASQILPQRGQYTLTPHSAIRLGISLKIGLG